MQQQQKKPTVSNLIDLLNKPALIKWANNLGLEGIKVGDYTKQKMSDGVRIHTQIELYLSQNKPMIDFQTQFNFAEFIKGKEVLAIEKKIEHEDYEGRIDIKLKIGDDIYICDFKKKKDKDKVYFEQKIQLAAYMIAENVSKAGIISYPDFKLIEVNIDLEKYKKLINNLVSIYNLKKELA